MKIGVVTVWYNEEDLAPFFLSHYGFADQIFVYLEGTDRTEVICQNFSNVIVEDFKMPMGFDDFAKIGRINRAIHERFWEKFDWVISVDADEFVLAPKNCEDMEHFLLAQERLGYNVVYSKMFQVYRHETDEDLDSSKPALWQRQHGDPDFHDLFNAKYIKPNVIKPCLEFEWNTGCHSIKKMDGARSAPEMLVGAHWKMADESFAAKRRIEGGRDRASERNRKLGFGYQDLEITEVEIQDMLEKHRRDPNVLGALLPEEVK